MRCVPFAPRWTRIPLFCWSILTYAWMQSHVSPRNLIVTALSVYNMALIGLAFSSCLIAFTATQKNDVGFSAIFRFVINPLFLFSGTFFPLSQLPDQVEWVPWLTPLFHGVELVRGAVLGTLDLATAPLHLAYLLVMFGIGAWLAERNLTKRMAG